MKTFLRKAFKKSETDIIIKKKLAGKVLFIHFETLQRALLAAFIWLFYFLLFLFLKAVLKASELNSFPFSFCDFLKHYIH